MPISRLFQAQFVTTCKADPQRVGGMVAIPDYKRLARQEPFILDWRRCHKNSQQIEEQCDWRFSLISMATLKPSRQFMQTLSYREWMGQSVSAI